VLGRKEGEPQRGAKRSDLVDATAITFAAPPEEEKMVTHDPLVPREMTVGEKENGGRDHRRLTRRGSEIPYKPKEERRLPVGGVRKQKGGGDLVQKNELMGREGRRETPTKL